MPADRTKSATASPGKSPRKATSVEWTAEHDNEIVRAIIEACFAHRDAMRSRPGFEGVNGNSGSKINDKLKQMLSKLPNGKALVDEAAKGMKRGPRKGGGSGSD